MIIIDVKLGVIYNEFKIFKLGDTVKLYDTDETDKILFINKTHVVFRNSICLTILQFCKANFYIFNRKQINIKMI
jgi:hypothetical protein